MENYRTSTKNPENTFNQSNELSELRIWNSTVLPEFWLKQISCVQITINKSVSQSIGDNLYMNFLCV